MVKPLPPRNYTEDRGVVLGLCANLALFCASWQLSNTVSLWAEQRGAKRVNWDSPPLPDLLHELLPHTPWDEGPLHPDLFPLALSLSLPALLLRCPRPAALISEATFTWAAVLFLRTLCVGSTQLPSPTAVCQSRTYLSSPERNPFFFCNDSIFSGHSAMNVLVALVWWRSPAPRALAALVAFVAGCGALHTVTSHYHYTVDMVLAIIIVVGAVELRRDCFLACWRTEVTEVAGGAGGLGGKGVLGGPSGAAGLSGSDSGYGSYLYTSYFSSGDGRSGGSSGGGSGSSSSSSSSARVEQSRMSKHDLVDAFSAWQLAG